MSIVPERRVSAYLVSRPNPDLCDSCVIAHTKLPSEAVAEQVTLLARTPMYLRDVWECTDCGQHGPVTRALANRASNLQEVSLDALGDTGRAHRLWFNACHAARCTALNRRRLGQSGGQAPVVRVAERCRPAVIRCSTPNSRVALPE